MKLKMKVFFCSQNSNVLSAILCLIKEIDGPSPFGKRVSRRGREKRDSEEVRLHNFVYLGGVVHDMRKLWRPYSQSYFWAEPPKIMLGQVVVSTT